MIELFCNYLKIINISTESWLTMIKECPECNGKEFAQGSDYMHVRPLGKKLSSGTNKIITYCKNCGEIVSARLENPEKL